MYKYDMELLLIMMDHNKIHNSFAFKSRLVIKYQEFLMILPKLPMTFIEIYDTQSHITHKHWKCHPLQFGTIVTIITI